MGIVALVLLLSASAYGFAAANTVPATNAGDGNTAISGYTITAVHYTLNGTTPSNIDSVGFTIAPSIPAGGVVYAKLRSASTTYFSCTITGGVTISCNTAGETASAVNELRVVAAQ
jgi:hypothetical protein